MALLARLGLCICVCDVHTCVGWGRSNQRVALPPARLGSVCVCGVHTCGMGRSNQHMPVRLGSVCVCRVHTCGIGRSNQHVQLPLSQNADRCKSQ